MSNIKYLSARILKMNYIDMFRVARDIAGKTGKKVFEVIIDIIHCGIKFQSGYCDYQEFEFYLLNDEQRATYLTRGKNNQIVKKYNNKNYMSVFENKIEFNTEFKDFIHREWASLEDIDEEGFEQFINRNPVFIAKPSDGMCGVGVEEYIAGNYSSPRVLYDFLKKKRQNLVEEAVIQHRDMNLLYPDSLNTMRIYTFFSNGKAHMLQAILKIGNGGIVDNFSSGGMYTFLNSEGIVTAPAVDKKDNVYIKHPISGTYIVGFKVPKFREAVLLAEKAAEKFPQIGYVGWDVGISENGPLIIEGNPFPGVFQTRASFSESKTGVIPAYRRYMEI